MQSVVDCFDRRRYTRCCCRYRHEEGTHMKKVHQMLLSISTRGRYTYKTLPEKLQVRAMLDEVGKKRFTTWWVTPAEEGTPDGRRYAREYLIPFCLTSGLKPSAVDGHFCGVSGRSTFPTCCPSPPAQR